MKKFKTLKDVEEFFKNEICLPRNERQPRYFRDACLWKTLGNLVYDPYPNLMMPFDEGQNVAGVCFGYAFELFYKTLILVEDKEVKKEETEEKEPRKTHELLILHKQLSSMNQKDIEEIVKGFTDDKPIKFLERIDKTLTSPRRRYYQVKAQRLNERGEREMLQSVSQILKSLENFIIEKVKAHCHPFQVTKTSSGEILSEEWLLEAIQKNVNDLIKRRCKDYCK